MTNPPTVPKRITTALFSSLGAGVVPRTGIEHIVVGRKPEIEAVLDDLANVAEGGAGFRVISGRYGAGKSFLLQLLRNYAMNRNFVVADADLSPERRLTGGRGQGLATYRELARNLSTRVRPDGGALPAMLEKWISGVQGQVVAGGITPGDPRFGSAVEARIHEAVNELEGLVHGFDFANVISAYWRGHQLGSDELKNAALKWLRGEYSTKTEAREALGVRVIIDDDTWYDYVKLLAQFVKAIGYAGLVVVIDEAVNLYKITQSVSRHANYEKLLTMLNDTLQGRAQYLQLLVGATPQMVDDTRRGLFSYEALRTRLEQSRFARDGLQDYAGPVLRLETLSNEEVYTLLTTLRRLHALHHGYATTISDEELLEFMNEVLGRLGAGGFLTPRDVTRDFVSVLNLLRQNPEQTFLGLVKGPDFVPSKTDVLAEARREEALPVPTSAEFAAFDL
ncbi:ATP-binding protein [Deinococcus marmoris]|uniref:ATP-binding protein n=1 Tax=Deinococcus marmoris TaxID=249408 RepID=UPI0009DE7365|nr:ATP-binding protein [Deinococcus marmoris]